MPATEVCLGLTGRIGPSKPARRRLSAVTAPTEWARGLAPISAMLFGRKIVSRLRTLNEGTGPCGHDSPIAPASAKMLCEGFAHGLHVRLHRVGANARNDAAEMDMIYDIEAANRRKMAIEQDPHGLPGAGLDHPLGR